MSAKYDHELGMHPVDCASLTPPLDRRRARTPGWRDSSGNGLLPFCAAVKTTTPLRFGLPFVISFALLMGGFEATRGTAFERFVVERLILVPTTELINTVTPHEQVQLIGRTITAPSGSSLRVTRGCEGIEMFLLLIAAIAAFPASLKRRVQGLLLGSLLAYILSVTRLMILHYILRYSPTLWETLHGFLLPLGPVVLMALFFLRWSSPPNTPASPDQATHAT
jgi:exosortase family protein XrtM